MSNLLGLDISSTTIGWCALTINESAGTFKLKDYGYIKPIKTGTIIERIVDTRNVVKELLDRVEPDYVGIEDIVQFIQGRSTANTVITLTSFNRMIGLLCYDWMGKLPELFSVMSIRHGLKIGKIFPKKEDMPELVAKHLGIKFPYTKGKTGKLKVENYDIADGMAVALYYAFILTGKTKGKTKLIKK